MADTEPSRAVDQVHPTARRRTLRTIAAFEAIKGLAALAGLIGLVDLMHRDVRHLAIDLIGRFGWDPHARYPSVLLHYAELLPKANLHALLFLALGYIFLRLLEAYGLWKARTWGEWLGAASGGLYIPFEIRHLWHRPSAISAAVLAANAFVVGFLVFQLWRRRNDDVTRRQSLAQANNTV